MEREIGKIEWSVGEVRGFETRRHERVERHERFYCSVPIARDGNISVGSSSRHNGKKELSLREDESLFTTDVTD